jgi:hypothetical protein
VGKLASGLLYLPEPGWKEEWGAHTVYYQAKHDHSLDQNWKNVRLNVDDLEPFHVNNVVRNHLCLFLKSANSHHALRALECPPGTARDMLNLNVLKAKGRSGQQLTRLRARGRSGVGKARRLIGRS